MSPPAASYMRPGAGLYMCIYIYIKKKQVRLHRNIAASSLAADCNVPQRRFTSIKVVHTHKHKVNSYIHRTSIETWKKPNNFFHFEGTNSSSAIPRQQQLFGCRAKDNLTIFYDTLQQCSFRTIHICSPVQCLQSKPAPLPSHRLSEDSCVSANVRRYPA